MTTPREYHVIAEHSYKEPENDLPNRGYKDLGDLGWRYVMSSNEAGLSRDGYFGAIFKKDNEFVVVHRGTNLFEISTSSEMDDILQLASGKVPDQIKYALEFSEKAQALKGNADRVVQLGHSYGGPLAHASGIKYDSLVIMSENPGTLEVVSQLYSAEQIEAHKPKIISYAAAPNWINTHGTHVATPIQIVFETPINDIGLLSYASSFTFGQHSIGNIIKEGFDEITGQPKFTVTYKDGWPKEGYSYFRHYALFEYSKPVRVQGLNREKVATEYNIGILRVSEAGDFLDPNGMMHKVFTIIPESYVPGKEASFWDDIGAPIYNFFNDLPNSWSNFVQNNAKPTQNNLNSEAKNSLYEIKAGDTLWDIAQSYGTTVETILLLPGNEKYLERTKLGKNGEVQHVLIKAGEKLVLPKPGSKLYPGNFKEKLQEVLGENKLKGVEVKTNKDGRVVTNYLRYIVVN